MSLDQSTIKIQGESQGLVLYLNKLFLDNRKPTVPWITLRVWGSRLNASPILSRKVIVLEQVKYCHWQYFIPDLKDLPRWAPLVDPMSPQTEISCKFYQRPLTRTAENNSNPNGPKKKKPPQLFPSENNFLTK